MKKRILICDDQPRFISEFKKRYSQDYEIEVVDDVRKVMAVLQSSSQWPDLLMLDLYHPLAVDATFEEHRQAAEKELALLDAQIKKTKAAVELTWSPLGAQVLQELRQHYKAEELPVIIYSQSGLFVLDEEGVRTIEENDGEWLLKKQFGPLMEKTRMERVMRIARRGRLVKKYQRALGVSWAVTLFMVSLHFLPFPAVWWHLLLGLGGGLLSYLVVKKEDSID